MNESPDTAQLIEALQQQISSLDKLTAELKRNGDSDKDPAIFCEKFRRWQQSTLSLLQKISSREYQNLITTLNESYAWKDEPDETFKKVRAFLITLITELEVNPDLVRKMPPPSLSLQEKPASILNKIFQKFHRVAQQLKNRHATRPTLEIVDEYDVQNLLHALLMIEFDDIRPEESTPSHAGNASRIDFLLFKEKIVVEVKKTRKNLGKKEVKEELIVDIANYKTHPNCKRLECFVYDPDNKISNPKGFCDDLSGINDGLEVRVTIVPKI